jgi:hypothetical protein
MTMQAVAGVDQKSKGLLRVGGISMVIVGLLYFAFVVLLSLLGSSFSSGETALQKFAGEALTVNAAFGLGIVSDFFFIPAVLALYFALRGINRNAMLVAVGFLSLFIIVDFGFTNLNFLALVTLSKNYLASTSDVQRAGYVATADYALAVLALSAPIGSYLVPSIGTLIASLVMLKGIFSRGVAYLGIVVGVLGILYGGTVLGLRVLPNVFVAITTVLSAIWFVLVGFKLYQLGGR